MSPSFAPPLPLHSTHKNGVQERFATIWLSKLQPETPNYCRLKKHLSDFREAVRLSGADIKKINQVDLHHIVTTLHAGGNEFPTKVQMALVERRAMSLGDLKATSGQAEIMAAITFCAPWLVQPPHASGCTSFHPLDPFLCFASSPAEEKAKFFKDMFVEHFIGPLLNSGEATTNTLLLVCKNALEYFGNFDAILEDFEVVILGMVTLWRGLISLAEPLSIEYIAEAEELVGSAMSKGAMADDPCVDSIAVMEQIPHWKAIVVDFRAHCAGIPQVFPKFKAHMKNLTENPLDCNILTDALGFSQKTTCGLRLPVKKCLERGIVEALCAMEKRAVELMGTEPPNNEYAGELMKIKDVMFSANSMLNYDMFPAQDVLEKLEVWLGPRSSMRRNFRTCWRPQCKNSVAPAN